MELRGVGETIAGVRNTIWRTVMKYERSRNVLVLVEAASSVPRTNVARSGNATPICVDLTSGCLQGQAVSIMRARQSTVLAQNERLIVIAPVAMDIGRSDNYFSMQANRSAPALKLTSLLGVECQCVVCLSRTRCLHSHQHWLKEKTSMTSYAQMCDTTPLKARGLMAYFPNPLIIPIGLIIGILVAAPVGPVNVLCIQRAIERGFWGGMAAGIGSVMGDGLIALCAGLGVGAVSGAFQSHRMIIEIIGGLAFLAFGLKLYTTEPNVSMRTTPELAEASLKDFVWDIPQTFFLTITNPGAVLGLFAIFGGVSTFVEVKSTIDVLLMVAAIMAGSLLWWFSLSNLISRYRHLIDASKLHSINRIAGILLLGFGALLIVEVVVKSGWV